MGHTEVGPTHPETLLLKSPAQRLSHQPPPAQPHLSAPSTMSRPPPRARLAQDSPSPSIWGDSRGDWQQHSSPHTPASRQPSPWPGWQVSILPMVHGRKALRSHLLTLRGHLAPSPPLQGRLLRDPPGSKRAPPRALPGCPARYSGDAFGFTAHFTVRKTVMRNEHRPSLQLHPR